MSTTSFNMRLASTVSILAVILALASPALAFTDRYLPFSKPEQRQSFPLSYLGELSPDHLLSTLPVGPSGATASTNHQDLLLSGKDRLSNKWTIVVSGEGIGMPYSAYTADLDHDGYPTSSWSVERAAAVSLHPPISSVSSSTRQDARSRSPQRATSGTTNAASGTWWISMVTEGPSSYS